MSTFRYIMLLFVLLSGLSLSAQQSKQEKLEAQRQQLRAEIAQMRQLRSQNKKKQRSVLDEVEALNAQIGKRQRLIKITNQQANVLSRNINANQKKIKTYTHELKVLKEDYAEMIVKSYRSKSQQSRIMFLLSSSDFTQAYKRLQYMKQYNTHRRAQGDQIQSRTEALKTINVDLVQQGEEKAQLIAENKVAQQELRTTKKEQERLVAKIKKKATVYTKKIKEKEKKANAIDRAIDKLIRAAIAKANKKAGKKVTKKGSATSFALTAETKKLADNFTANKGKLPWPVGTGRVTKRFGQQPHPTLPNIKINSSGVEIETSPGEKARAIFEGEVIAIQQLKGASKLVQVRHGNYITTYYNLEKIVVKEGQKIATKAVIGQVRTNPATGRAVMKFLIYQNAKKLNPQTWIYKM